MTEPNEERRRPFEPKPLTGERVHWPARFGREELMIETLPEISRDTAEHLIRELLRHSGIDAELPNDNAMTFGVRYGIQPIRFVTMNLELNGTLYVVTLEQDRATVLPDRRG